MKKVVLHVFLFPVKYFTRDMVYSLTLIDCKAWVKSSRGTDDSVLYFGFRSDEQNRAYYSDRVNSLMYSKEYIVKVF